MQLMSFYSLTIYKFYTQEQTAIVGSSLSLLKKSQIHELPVPLLPAMFKLISDHSRAN